MVYCIGATATPSAPNTATPLCILVLILCIVQVPQLSHPHQVQLHHCVYWCLSCVLSRCHSYAICTKYSYTIVYSGAYLVYLLSRCHSYAIRTKYSHMCENCSYTIVFIDAYHGVLYRCHSYAIRTKYSYVCEKCSYTIVYIDAYHGVLYRCHSYAIRTKYSYTIVYIGAYLVYCLCQLSQEKMKSRSPVCNTEKQRS